MFRWQRRVLDGLKPLMALLVDSYTTELPAFGDGSLNGKGILSIVWSCGLQGNWMGRERLGIGRVVYF